MKSLRPLLVLLLLAALPDLTSAGVFFTKKGGAKVDPAQKVKELLTTVKTDGDESKRFAAVEELREYEPSQFPEVVSVLCDVLLTDAKVSVRAEAAQTLGKYRPVNQQAGMALEQAVAKDASMRVRLSARAALVSYYMAGFRAGKKDEGQWPNSKEPPLADPAGKTPPVAKTPTPPRTNSVQPTRVIPNETAPPPLADPEPRAAPLLVPTAPPNLQPTPIGNGEGPMLIPPG